MNRPEVVNYNADLGYDDAFCPRLTYRALAMISEQLDYFIKLIEDISQP